LFGPVLSRLKIVSLSLIAGGGFSNLIDRIANGGYVVDFLNIGLGGIRTGIFNIADMAIMMGGILLIAISLKHERSAGF
jgi:signal peptidase II